LPNNSEDAFSGLKVNGTLYHL